MFLFCLHIFHKIQIFLMFWTGTDDTEFKFSGIVGWIQDPISKIQGAK